MDTPAIPLPRDDREREILVKLEATRDQLLLLKRDRTKYIRSQDVLQLYEETVEQVRQLREVRADRDEGENRRWSHPIHGLESGVSLSNMLLIQQLTGSLTAAFSCFPSSL